MEKLHGLIVATFTPFKSSLVDLGAVGPYMEYLVANEVSGVFVNGTTGESHSLTLDERLRLAESWLDAAPTGFPVIIHAGNNCLPDCCAMSRHAQEHGAWAVSAMAPNFFKPSLDELVEFMAEVAAAAPELPFYYYHMPSMTGLPHRAIDFLRQAAGRIPNLAGVKFSYEDLMDYTLCVDYADGRYDIVFGRDEILLSSVVVGARAAIGSTYNFIAPLYRRLLDLAIKGDFEQARLLQILAVKVISRCMLASSRGLPAIRALTEWRMGADLGVMRAPTTPLLEGILADLQEDVEEIAGPYLSLPPHVV
jgi:N-acetylneuraminate lyase